MSFLHGCRANFPNALRLLRLFFLDTLLFFVLVVQRVERFLVSVLHAYVHRTGNYTSLLSNTVLCSLLMAFSWPRSTRLSPATRNNCSSFNSLISGVKVSQSEFLFHDSASLSLLSLLLEMLLFFGFLSGCSSNL